MGVTKTGAKAMYNYASGKATWIWSAQYFGFLKQAPGTKGPLRESCTTDSALARVRRTPADGLGQTGQTPAIHPLFSVPHY